MDILAWTSAPNTRLLLNWLLHNFEGPWRHFHRTLNTELPIFPCLPDLIFQLACLSQRQLSVQNDSCETSQTAPTSPPTSNPPSASCLTQPKAQSLTMSRPVTLLALALAISLQAGWPSHFASSCLCLSFVFGLRGFCPGSMWLAPHPFTPLDSDVTFSRRPSLIAWFKIAVPKPLLPVTPPPPALFSLL